MSKAISGLKLFQWGKEGDATPGTLIAATSKIAVVDMQFDPLDTVYRPKLAKGLILANPGNETVVTRGTKFSVPETPVLYDQIQSFLGMCVAELAAPTGVGPYTWTYTRNILADPDIETRTIERRITDGTNNIDVRWGYAFLESISFIYRADQALMFSCEGVARRIQTNALTAALNFPTIEVPAAALAQVWIDSTWAALGTTLIAAQVLSAEVKFTSGYKTKMALDGRTDLDFSMHVLDADAVNLEVTLRVMIEANAGQYATEKTAAEAQTLRAVRLKVLGTATRELTLDMLLKHEPGSLFKIGEEDGQDIVEVKLVGATDGTNFFSAKVVNQQATVI